MLFFFDIAQEQERTLTEVVCYKDLLMDITTGKQYTALTTGYGNFDDLFLTKKGKGQFVRLIVCMVVIPLVISPI